MRLKFLFFPIMLIISVSIFIGYIWPEISHVRSINEEKMANEKILEQIKEKQRDIESVGQRIASDNSGQALVRRYLPVGKTEEQIISNINYLATDAGVSLVDISLSDSMQHASAGEKNANVASAIASNINAIKTGELSSIESENKSTLKDENGMRFLEAKISISGDYQKAKLFLDQVQHVSLYNEIKSLTIAGPRKVADAAVDVATPIDDGSVSMEVILEFGYMKFFSLSNQRVSKFKPELDIETMEALKSYISTRSASGGIDNEGSKGKANPFLQ